MTFLEELREQRWDDHRYYHQSRINQSLHLFSASCFLVTYALIPFQPIVAALLGWVVAFWSRQIGHFFFEPTEYDERNEATFAHKEAIKVGFNLQRKVLLLVAWLAVPAGLYLAPKLGLRDAFTSGDEFLHQLGVVWLWLAAAGLLSRTLWLCATRNVQTGVVWFTKILTDPFNDVRTYYKAPYYLFIKGEKLDPSLYVRTGTTPSAAPSAHHA
ncbi:MAG: Mpo1-like protein [Myxococcaceae bacterium]